MLDPKSQEFRCTLALQSFIITLQINNHVDVLVSCMCKANAETKSDNYIRKVYWNKN